MSIPLRPLLGVVLLVLDVSRLVQVPWLDSAPNFFVAFVAYLSLKSGPLAGGAWGFGGGLAVGLMEGGATAGPLSLGGLAAGAFPGMVKHLIFWRHPAGQAALGALAGALYGGVQVVVAVLHGQVSPPVFPLALRLLVDALLTGAVCPLLGTVVERMEKRH
jgi:hypothetical protein